MKYIVRVVRYAESGNVAWSIYYGKENTRCSHLGLDDGAKESVMAALYGYTTLRGCQKRMDWAVRIHALTTEIIGGHSVAGIVEVDA